jgi:hypothetical protein
MGLVKNLANAEVKKLYLLSPIPSNGKHYIGGLEISVNDAYSVCCIERSRDLL